MKILFFTQHFNLPDEPGFSRPYQFAKRWVELGNEVMVITSAYNYHAGRILDKRRKRLISTSTIEGIKVIRIRLRGYSFKNEFLFFTIATWISLFLRKNDVIIASSKPLTTGIPALIMGLLWQRPFLLEVRDLYNKWRILYNLFYFNLENVLYKNAKKIIGVSKFICADAVKKGKAMEDVIYIPHGVDNWVFNENPTPAPLIPNNKFKCILSAALQSNNEVNFEFFMETVELLRDRPDIHFFIVGTGNLIEELKSKGLENITFLGGLSKRKVVDYIKAADLCILPLREKIGSARIDWIMPVKLFDYFGCARAVVAIAPQREIREIIIKAEAGIVADSNSAESLAEAILHAKLLGREKCLIMGENGYAYAKEFHNLVDFADKAELLMNSL